MPKYVCVICVFSPSWANSRVVCGEGFGSLAVSLDGLHGSGVKHPLTHRSPSVPPCLARLTPLSLAVVQDVHTQQQAVVHDLKTLQHLQQVDKTCSFTRIAQWVHWHKPDCNEHWDYSLGLNAFAFSPDGKYSVIMKCFEKHIFFLPKYFHHPTCLGASKDMSLQKEISVQTSFELNKQGVSPQWAKCYTLTCLRSLSPSFPETLRLHVSYYSSKAVMARQG